MKRNLVIGIVMGFIVIIGGGILAKYKLSANNNLTINSVINKNQLEKAANYNFTYNIDPETFEITTEYKGVKEVASQPLEPMKVANLKKTSDSISWIYPDKNIKVNIKKEDNYLNVQITSTIKGVNSFEFLNLSAGHYTLPIGEGKYIPNNNA